MKKQLDFGLETSVEQEDWLPGHSTDPAAALNLALTAHQNYKNVSVHLCEQIKIYSLQCSDMLGNVLVFCEFAMLLLAW